MNESVHSPVRATSLGFLVLALFVGESLLTILLLCGNLQPQQKLVCVWAGISFFVVTIAAGTALIRLKPIGIVERIVDIPSSDVDVVEGDFTSEGAWVRKIPQGDGRYTLEVLFFRS